MGHECEGNINARQELAKSAIVVDDEQAITDLVSTVLLYEGFDVEVASTGRAALDSVPSFRPDRSEHAEGDSPDPFAPNAAEESALDIGREAIGEMPSLRVPSGGWIESAPRASTRRGDFWLWRFDPDRQGVVDRHEHNWQPIVRRPTVRRAG